MFEKDKGSEVTPAIEQGVKPVSSWQSVRPDVNKRKRYGADFKVRVALEALKGDLTLAQLATKHGVQQGQISSWRKQAVERMAGVFRANPKQVTPASKSIVKSFMPRSASSHWRMIAA